MLRLLDVRSFVTLPSTLSTAAENLRELDLPRFDLLVTVSSSTLGDELSNS